MVGGHLERQYLTAYPWNGKFVTPPGLLEGIKREKERRDGDRTDNAPYVVFASGEISMAWIKDLLQNITAGDPTANIVVVVRADTGNSQELKLMRYPFTVGKTEAGDEALSLEEWLDRK